MPIISDYPESTLTALFSRMIRLLAAGLLMFFCSPLPPAYPQSPEEIRIGDFSSTGTEEVLPSDWEPLVFKKIKNHTEYKLVQGKTGRVLRAESRASASGLIRKKRMDPRIYPVLKWTWRVDGILENGDVFQKDGDDYSARVYIMFEYTPQGLSLFEKMKFKAAKIIYGEYPPTGAICYVWGNKAPKDTVVSNAYTDHLKMIVVESGKEKINTWVTVERNLLDDYRNAFGREPAHISGIAIMTDSDNTGENATAYYGDIILAGLP